MALLASRCSLRKCIQGDLEAGMARVEVASYEVPVEDVQHMEVAWTDGGEAVFHDICWKALLDSVKMENPFSLSALEKDLVIEAKKTAEYFDSREKVKAEGRRIANMLRSSKYAIAFTGAGVSTSSGIGDFRGKSGMWTKRDRDNRFGPAKQNNNRNFCGYELLRPTYSHEALCKLVELGFIKHLISQNTDGLHRLSGIPRDRLSELHGNSFHEKCEKCSARYERPYAVRRSSSAKVPLRICVHCHFDHRTGRLCERKGCGGYLMNSIINFGDSLEKRVLSTATEQAKQNDLVLCLGSSLRVTPACDLVEMGLDPVRLVICNRQPTPFDKLCYMVQGDVVGSGCGGAGERSLLGSRVFGDCDELMKEVMACLVPHEELLKWQDEHASRLDEYDKQRQVFND